MDMLKCCRICLNINVKMYHISSNNLKYYYDLMLQDSSPNMLPSYVCYECASFLYKCNLFREKCRRGQNVLHNIHMISSEEIEKIDREGNNLKSSLQYAQLHHIITIVDNDANENCDTEIKLESSLHKTNSTSNIAYQNNDVKEEYYVSEDMSSADIVNSDKNKIPSTKESYDSKYVVSLENIIFVKVNSNANGTKNPHKTGNTELNHNRTNKKPKMEECHVTKNKHKIKKIINSTNTISKNLNFSNKHIVLDEDKWKIIILNQEEAYREYNKREQTSRNFPYRCDLCLKGFSKYDIMKRHLPVHSEERGPHECDICKRRFKWRNILRYHRNKHHIRYHCLKCFKIFNNVSVALIHEKCHDGKKFTCSLCNAEFQNKSTYYSHVRLKHRSQFVCQMCGESFVSEFGLHQHTKRIHSMDIINFSEESFHCEKCDKIFTNKSAYVKHISNSSAHCDDTKDDKDITYEIKKCLFKIRNSTHTPESQEPATCDQCGDVFKSTSSCIKHLKRVHAESKGGDGGERLVCEICGVYVLKSNARNHRNRHTRAVQFPCSTCGRVFNSPSNRHRHMVVHTGQKPYSCKVCSKSYSQRAGLKKHNNTHHLKLTRGVQEA